VAIECFNELFNTVYIAKKLHEMGKYKLVTGSFFDLLDHDVYYENMYSLIENLFEHHYSDYYENHSLELHILSDSVIVDFYVLAGKYSRRNNISDKDNPYIKAAEREVKSNLNISHCLDWKLMVHTEPKRPFHSRLGLFISQECDCLDLGFLAYRLIKIYEWFSDKCTELRAIEESFKPIPGQMCLDEFMPIDVPAIAA